MRPKLRLYLIALLCNLSVWAQQTDLATVPSDTSYWLFGGNATGTFSQVSLTNWSAGGDNSISLNGYFNVYADYSKGKVSWSNNLELGYGIVKQGTGGKPRKTDDIIIATTEYGYKLSNKIFWTTILDFRTQFYRGVDANGKLISNFMTPGYLLLATGFEWKTTPTFSVKWAPLTGKATFVLDDDLAASGAFGVTKGLTDLNGNIISAGSNARFEVGTFLKLRYAKENLLPNVNFRSKLELFTNYVENFGEIDVNWQNTLVMKVNSFLSVNFQTQLLYDKDIEFTKTLPNGDIVNEGDKVQFKSVLGLGISYNFGKKKS